jgi:membrane protease YdiL (CAAX protease family)
MNESEPILNPQNDTWVDRLQALFEVFLLSGVISSTLAMLPFAVTGHRLGNLLLYDVGTVVGVLMLEAALTLVFLALVMKAHRETLEELGLIWREWKPNLLIGLAVVPVLFLASAIISEAFQVFLPKYVNERNPLLDIVHTPHQLVLFVLSALVAGGVKEELQRALILTRFEQHLGGAKLGLAIWSIAFGLGHYLQGVVGVVVASVFGFIFGALYLVRGNLIAPMIAHGLYDALAILGYWFSQGMGK